MHLAVLIETMRREEYEFAISKPQVILKKVEGTDWEPIERAHIEVPQQYSGTVIEELSRRRGEMQALQVSDQDIASFNF